MSEYRWEWFDTCPSCGASAGKPCIRMNDIGGPPPRAHHKGRLKLPQHGGRVRRP